MVTGNHAMDRKKLQHFIFIGLFILIEILLIRRSFYGFNTADEMYFIGTSERIFRGERILIDEWNPTQQLCSFLLHPIYCLMRGIIGSLWAGIFVPSVCSLWNLRHVLQLH